MKEIKQLLKRFFGYSEFRTAQADIIKSLISGRDCIVLMPTGGGKSICFQLPAIYLKGTAIVISPLVALMKDQVEGLQANGVPAVALNSSLPEKERQRTKQLCLEGKVKLLYLSPEGLMSEMEWLLPHLDISMFAIDEAHCISHWGHDFRPEYTQLSILKERFPQVPIIALTATADKVTRFDIIDQLNIQRPKIFISSFDRPNLSLNVMRGLLKKDKLATINRFISKHKGQSGIVYCMKRKDTEMMANFLISKGLSARPYHAGLTPALRNQAQNEFINDHISVICATVAFGMGIDKSNVRWVIHYNMPGSIESYYQEIGRAGRDGLPSDTLLFYSYSDLIVQRHFIEDSGQKDINTIKLNTMQRFCETDVCRRRVLLNYFGQESSKDCGNCDVCRNPPKRFDGTLLVQKALSAIVRTDEHIALNMTIDILRASARSELVQRGYDKLKTYGAGRDLSYTEWREYLYQMLQLGFIEIDYERSSTFHVTPLGREVLFGKRKAEMAVYREPTEMKQARDRKSAKPKTAQTIAFDDKTNQLRSSLKQLRKQLAAKRGIPAYLVFNDATIEELATLQPRTLEDFAVIKGVGEKKLEQYGKLFTSVINAILK